MSRNAKGYSLIQWKLAVELLNARPRTRAIDLAKFINVSRSGAEKIKSEYHKNKRNEDTFIIPCLNRRTIKKYFYNKTLYQFKIIDT